jgi:type IV pilus biogenesis protein CpaD/CtpE
MMTTRLWRPALRVLAVVLLAVAFGSAATAQAPTAPLPVPYEGFPPLVPHDVEPHTACTSCHADPDSGAPLTPHATRTNCLQCHVTQDPSVTAFPAPAGGK